MTPTQATIEKRPPIGRLSIDAKVLYDRLLKATPAEPVTYQELSEIIGRDVRDSAYGQFRTAIKKALHEDGLVFATVQKVGVKLLTDAEIADHFESDSSRIARMSKRAFRKLSCVRDYDGLPTLQKVRYNVGLSLSGIITHITSTKSVKRLTGAVERAQAALPLAKTLEAFRENGAAK